MREHIDLGRARFGDALAAVDVVGGQALGRDEARARQMGADLFLDGLRGLAETVEKAR
jgi:hypothetical protein